MGVRWGDGYGSEMGDGCGSNIVLGARRPNGTALLVGSVDRAQTCIWLGARLCEPPVAKWDRSFGRLLYLASNVNLALRSSMRATSFLSLALGWRGLLRATWVGGGPFPTFFPRRGESPRVYGSHVFLVTCAWLAQTFASHVGGRGPFPIFSSAWRVS